MNNVHAADPGLGFCWGGDLAAGLPGRPLPVPWVVQVGLTVGNAAAVRPLVAAPGPGRRSVLSVGLRKPSQALVTVSLGR